MILGGGAKRVLERVVEWGDGWMPNHTKPSDIEAARARLDALARAAGRNPAAITISVFGQSADRELARRYHDAGAERVIVRPGTAKTEEEMGVELERIAGSVLR